MIFLPSFHCPLVGVAGVRNFFLRKAAFDGRDHPAHRVEFLEVGKRALLHIQGQPFDKVRTAQRVDRIGHARFVGQDLLRAQGDSGRFFGRQSERLVKAVGMQALRASQHRGQGLDCYPRNVVLGLLRGQRHACRLGMKPHPVRARILGAETLCHQSIPKLARRAEFPDLLKKIVMRIEEEAQAAAQNRRSAARGAGPTPRTRRRHTK